MADEPAANFHYGSNLPPLTHADQGFVLLTGSTFFWTPNRADRQFVWSLVRDVLPVVNRDHPYIDPIAKLVHAIEQSPRAQTATHNTELSQRIHDFLRWRGLMALAKAQELGQIEGPKA